MLQCWSLGRARDWCPSCGSACSHVIRNLRFSIAPSSQLRLSSPFTTGGTGHGCDVIVVAVHHAGHFAHQLELEFGAIVSDVRAVADETGPWKGVGVIVNRVVLSSRPCHVIDRAAARNLVWTIWLRQISIANDFIQCRVTAVRDETGRLPNSLNAIRYNIRLLPISIDPGWAVEAASCILRTLLGVRVYAYAVVDAIPFDCVRARSSGVQHGAIEVGGAVLWAAVASSVCREAVGVLVQVTSVLLCQEEAFVTPSLSYGCEVGTGWLPLTLEVAPLHLLLKGILSHWDITDHILPSITSVLAEALVPAAWG